MNNVVSGSSQKFLSPASVEPLLAEKNLFGETFSEEKDREFEALLIGHLALSSLVNDERWITVVTTRTIDRQRYKALFGQNSRLRVVQTKPEDVLWISWQSLAQGNSQTVIAVVEAVEQEEREHLLEAAAIGQSTLHLIQVS